MWWVLGGHGLWIDIWVISIEFELRRPQWFDNHFACIHVVLCRTLIILFQKIGLWLDRLFSWWNYLHHLVMISLLIALCWGLIHIWRNFTMKSLIQIVQIFFWNLSCLWILYLIMSKRSWWPLLSVGKRKLTSRWRLIERSMSICILLFVLICRCYMFLKTRWCAYNF